MIFKHLTKALVLAFLTLGQATQGQDLLGFNRQSFGSVVLSQSQAAGKNAEFELAIGNYENEPIINYSIGSVFAQIGRSVGRLDVLTDKGLFPCTAFIVSDKHILTNYHCSLGLLANTRIGASRIDATQFVAGYTQTGIEEGSDKYTVVPIPVEADKRLDYAVLEVIGNPSQKYGQLKLASVLPDDGDPFWIIGHPMGEGQRISREKCKANKPALSAGKLLHTCDTLPGNSGSPVIDAGSQKVVALHHAGSKKDSVNYAILMSDILSNSKVLTEYKAPELPPKSKPKLEATTLEDKRCNTLYDAAQRAKVCYAYDAYLKHCKTHSLAPIAVGYVDEFCATDTSDSSPVAKIGKDKLSQRETVVSIQKQLNRVGCNAGLADGVAGRKTLNAIRIFALKAGFEYTEQLINNSSFIQKLRSTPADFCPKQKKKLVASSVNLRPLNIAMHWKITCKKSGGNASSQQYARVIDYNPQTGNISLILTNERGATNSAYGKITGNKFSLYNDTGYFNSDFTRLSWDSKDCPIKHTWQSLID